MGDDLCCGLTVGHSTRSRETSDERGEDDRVRRSSQSGVESRLRLIQPLSNCPADSVRFRVPRISRVQSFKTLHVTRTGTRQDDMSDMFDFEIARSNQHRTRAARARHRQTARHAPSVSHVGQSVPPPRSPPQPTPAPPWRRPPWRRPSSPRAERASTVVVAASASVSAQPLGHGLPRRRLRVAPCADASLGRHTDW